MISFEYIPLLFGSMMALIDVGMLGIIKQISINKKIRWMILPTLVYAIQPWIFLSSLTFESMVVMNLMWDLISDLLVTLSGVLIFKEVIGKYKIAGICLSFISIILLSMNDI